MSHPPEDRWHGYYQATQGRPPRHTLLQALDGFSAEGRAPELALDLGCGAGRDALWLLQSGWRVEAIDMTAEGLARLAAALPPGHAERLSMRAEHLEDCDLPAALLVNASFVLPFLERQAFLTLWRRIGRALPEGGRFAGQLFGRTDSWVLSGRCHGHDRAELDELLDGYDAELLEEEAHPGQTARGSEKYWHIWHLVLRRR